MEDDDKDSLEELENKILEGELSDQGIKFIKQRVNGNDSDDEEFTKRRKLEEDRQNGNFLLCKFE